PPECLSLFESRARHRKIRILVDERTMSFDADSPSDRILRFFLDSELVQAWYVHPPFPHVNDLKGTDEQVIQERIRVQELTGNLGPFEGGGMTYAYYLDESHDGETKMVRGQFVTGRPDELLLAARLGDAGDLSNQEKIEKVKTASALRVLANEINADIVISEEYSQDTSIRRVVDDSSFVEKGDALVVLAHY